MTIPFKENLKHSYSQSVDVRESSSLASWKQNEVDQFLSLFDTTSKPVKALDLGAGTGKFSRYMEDQGLDMTCIDLSPALVETCKNKGLHAIEMDFYDLKFEDASFDGIWAMNTLLHVPKQELPNVLFEIKRVMKPEGIFYMGVYGGKNQEGVWEEDTYSPQRFFSFHDEATIQETVSAVFKLAQFRKIALDGEFDFYSMILTGK